MCLLQLYLQAIGAEIAAHELTVEDMRRKNVANLPPSTAESKAARGGTMLDQLQVTLTPTGERGELQPLENIKMYTRNMWTELLSMEC